MPTGLKRLLNSDEEVVDGLLKEICEHRGARIFVKMRLADIFAIDGSGLDSEAYSFALKSHFDFTVSDTENRPLFAVEYDGPSHDTEEQMRRDQLKHRVVDHFDFPLLRVRDQHLERRFRGGRLMTNPLAEQLRSTPILKLPEEFREMASKARQKTTPIDWDLLSWFIENWFHYRELDLSYERGEIDDEIYFDALGMGVGYVLMDPRWPALIYPYRISQEPWLEVAQRHSRGEIQSMFPATAEGYDSEGNYRAFLFAEIDREFGVWSETGIRAQRFRLPDLHEVARAIAARDLLIKLDEAAVDSTVRVPLARIRQLESDFRARWFSWRRSGE